MHHVHTLLHRTRRTGFVGRGIADQPPPWRCWLIALLLVSTFRKLGLLGCTPLGLLGRRYGRSTVGVVGSAIPRLRLEVVRQVDVVQVGGQLNPRHSVQTGITVLRQGWHRGSRSCTCKGFRNQAVGCHRPAVTCRVVSRSCYLSAFVDVGSCCSHKGRSLSRVLRSSSSSLP